MNILLELNNWEFGVRVWFYSKIILHFFYTQPIRHRNVCIFVGAFPQEEQWRNIYHRVLDVENSDPFPDDDNCVQLAKATFSLLRYSCITHDTLPVTISTENFIEIGKKLFGFDVFTDEAALEEFTCNMASKCFGCLAIFFYILVPLCIYTVCVCVCVPLNVFVCVRATVIKRCTPWFCLETGH